MTDMLSTFSFLRKWKFHRILNRDSKPIGARGEAAKSRRKGKALRNRVIRQTNTQWMAPNRETRPLGTGKQTGKGFLPQTGKQTGKEFRL
jgi:hypothetical protein